jgi:hypothetical protein
LEGAVDIDPGSYSCFAALRALIAAAILCFSFFTRSWSRVSSDLRVDSKSLMAAGFADAPGVEPAVLSTGFELFNPAAESGFAAAVVDAFPDACPA